MPVLDETVDTANQAHERVALDRLAQRLQANHQVVATATLLDGPVAEALQRYTLAREVDLIVMTTHGRGAMTRFWLGNIADRLARQAPVPILLVRPRERVIEPAAEPTCHHVLILLDGSALAETILPHAIALGTLMQAEYTLLRVIEPTMGPYGTELYTAGLDEEALARSRASAQIYLDRVAASMRAEALRVRTAVVVGLTAPGILDYARGHAVDLIALATHGRSGLARLVLGSVADKIVRGAELPVLLHRPRLWHSAADISK
jgi:nucleotide-binding universal stress UspA family protein